MSRLFSPQDRVGTARELMRRVAALQRPRVVPAPSQSAEQPTGLPFIWCMNISRFRWVNLVLNNREGDEALRSLGRGLVQQPLQAHEVFHLGTDMFAVLLPELMTDEAPTVARALHETARQALAPWDTPAVRESMREIFSYAGVRTSANAARLEDASTGIDTNVDVQRVVARTPPPWLIGLGVRAVACWLTQPCNAERLVASLREAAKRARDHTTVFLPNDQLGDDRWHSR